MLNDDWIANALDVLASGADSTLLTKHPAPRETFEAVTAEPDQAEITSPRKRGRPRKVREVSGGTSTSVAELPALPIPKKRGRPRKDALATVALASTVWQASPASVRDQIVRDPREEDVADGQSSTSDHNSSDSHNISVAGGTPITRGLVAVETHLLTATGDPDLVRDLPSDGNHTNIVANETLSSIVENHRRRWDMIRARQRLELQGQAVCRRLSDGDKVAAAKLWAEVAGDEGHELRGWLAPYFLAMAPLRSTQEAIEKDLTKLVRKLPVYPWAKEVKGLGDVSLAAIVGECVYPIGSYKSVAAVWKRMGLAVIGNTRQRKIAGDAAIEHGYNPERRAIMWNIGAGLIKAQVRKDPDDPEKRIGIGDYGQLYLDRKAYEAERVETKAHAHNRAQRYIEKRLLRELWKAWRRADGVADV